MKGVRVGGGQAKKGKYFIYNTDLQVIQLLIKLYLKIKGSIGIYKM